jgi:hypothetical protein
MCVCVHAGGKEDLPDITLPQRIKLPHPTTPCPQHLQAPSAAHPATANGGSPSKWAAAAGGGGGGGGGGVREGMCNGGVAVPPPPPIISTVHRLVGLDVQVRVCVHVCVIVRVCVCHCACVRVCVIVHVCVFVVCKR